MDTAPVTLKFHSDPAILWMPGHYKAKQAARWKVRDAGHCSNWMRT